MDIAREAISRLEHFLFVELGLQSSLSEVGIGRERLADMARKACRYGDIQGFMTLTAEDVERIYEMSL
jgi:alcohol dehydrogenase YqhD (iron-dependent ADH family)